ncbi:MAG: serine protease [Cyanobacteria bacterium RYN_339]|nr:serine protease [Cyanobacteria bacterium RYN_339]
MLLLALALAIVDGPLGPADRFTQTFNAVSGAPALDAGDMVNFHGTFSAGMVPRDLPLLGVQVRDARGHGTAEQLARGIDWAVAHGARVVLAYPARVFERGDVPGDAATAAVRRALARDVLVVTSAGNLGEAITPLRFPLATVPGVLAVGGLGRDGLPFKESNRGPQIGLAAKAEGVCSTYAFGLHVGASCTSWAATQVAVVATQLRGRHPDWTAGQVSHWLQRTARPLPGVAYGRLDPEAALR